MVTDNLKNNKTMPKLAVFSILLILVLMGVYFVNNARDSVIAKDKELSLLKRDYALLDRIEADKNENQEKIEALLKTLPQTYEEVGKLAYKIEKVAADHNMTASLFFAGEKKEEAGYITVDLDIETSGRFSDFNAFLSDLSDLPYNMEITDISTESKDGKVSHKATVKISLRK